MPEVALPPERTISPGSCWAGASPKEESGTLAGEAALGHVLAVPGQLLPTADLPRDTPAPPSGPTLRRQPHQLWRGPLYVHRRGVGTALADNYAGHYLVLEKGPKVFKLQLGERTDVVSREKAEATHRASATCGRGASTQGAAPQEKHKIFLGLQKISGE